FIQKVGKEKAKKYYEANKKAAEYIEECINLHQIDCDYTKENAYIYTNSNDYLEKLKKEEEAYKILEIDGEFVESIPLELAHKGALVMYNQAQFHPLHYLTYLIHYIKQNGGEIYEQSVATKMEEGEQTTIHFRNGVKVTAKYIISASHFP